MLLKKKKLSIGVSDFRKLITENKYFVDKSLFINDVVNGMEVLLYPRPRRFGKTLNLSMLNYFYDCREDNSNLFEGLAISQEEEIMQKQGKYPVIFLTFKDVKDVSRDISFEKIYRLISDLYNDKRYLLENDFMSEEQRIYYEKVTTGKASPAEYQLSLQYMTEFLAKYHKINPVVLIDEYDTPIHAGYLNKYYDEIIGFMRDFLSGALKDNKYLEKAVITGILRVSQESIFTGLNNITVCSILSEESNNRFGFTDAEVEQMLLYYDSCMDFNTVKKQYNGYNFSGTDIYNPWSILNSVKNKNLGHYWINTSSNELIKILCQEAEEAIKIDFQILLQGGRVNKHIFENIVFAELKQNNNAIWSFFTLCGYLRYDNYDVDKKANQNNAELSIPNKEILYIFSSQIIPFWFTRYEKTDTYINLAHLLTKGDLDVFQKEFIDFCMATFSYFDVAGDEPEKFYHAFVLGMIACLKDTYQIRSNRESGLGRYDIMLIPNDKSARGIIFEFKNYKKEIENYKTLYIIPPPIEKALENAKKQIHEKKYDQDMRAYGITDIAYIIAIFQGKEVFVENV